ncbi:LAFA_0B05578g1_1 [Lachancea sp. 'fantastica']|nr:LAFA_0B05578g1_1 [Lachancea sp. 'fantastica']
MLRSPTRTKTSSFGGSQVDFQFPPSPSTIQEKSLNNYQMSNHHLLNSAVLARDNASNLFSDSSAGLSNGIDSGNYSFANISDNTTARQGVHKGPKASYASSRGSNASMVRQRYPETLAPGYPSARKSDTAAFLHRKRSPDMMGHQSISTDACTIPTAENISFQITFESSPSEDSLVSLNKPAPAEPIQPSTRKESIKLAKKPSRARTVSSNRSRSKLKRSAAVRCKGGLLHFFSQLKSRTKSGVRRWRLAVRKKLFTYKAKRLAKKNQKQTTSHLKRANGYVSNIQRSISNNSIKVKTVKSDTAANVADTLAKKREDVQTPVQNSHKNGHNSLRRSPSSIKRAASTLTRVNTLANASSETANTIGSEPRSKLVRSDPSVSLSSIVRQPSIVVSNKVIPLSKLNGEMNDFSIKEEDEDEYVIDTEVMKRSDDNMSLSSNQSSSCDEQDYQDTFEYPHKEVHPEISQEKVSVALDGWNHYLRAVVAQRIATRLQIRKLQLSGTDAACEQLIKSLIPDHDGCSSSRYSDDVENELGSTTSGSAHKSPGQSSFDTASRRNDSSMTFTPLSSALQNSVKRSLTLPVGLRV